MAHAELRESFTSVSAGARLGASLRISTPFPLSVSPHTQRREGSSLWSSFAFGSDDATAPATTAPPNIVATPSAAEEVVAMVKQVEAAAEEAHRVEDIAAAAAVAARNTTTDVAGVSAVSLHAALRESCVSKGSFSSCPPSLHPVTTGRTTEGGLTALDVTPHTAIRDRRGSGSRGIANGAVSVGRSPVGEGGMLVRSLPGGASPPGSGTHAALRESFTAATLTVAGICCGGGGAMGTLTPPTGLNRLMSTTPHTQAREVTGTTTATDLLTTISSASPYDAGAGVASGSSSLVVSEADAAALRVLAAEQSRTPVSSMGSSPMPAAGEFTGLHALARASRYGRSSLPTGSSYAAVMRSYGSGQALGADAGGGVAGAHRARVLQRHFSDAGGCGLGLRGVGAGLGAQPPGATSPQSATGPSCGRSLHAGGGTGASPVFGASAPASCLTSAAVAAASPRVNPHVARRDGVPGWAVAEILPGRPAGSASGGCGGAGAGAAGEEMSTEYAT